MTSRRRVVITGIGAVTPCGWSASNLHTELLHGTTAIAPAQLIDIAGQRTSLAAEVPSPPSGPAIHSDEIHRLSRSDSFGVPAAREAVEQAALATGGAEIGVFFGSSTGGMLESEEFVGRLLRVRSGQPRVRALASQQVGCPGDAVARDLGTVGPVQTISSACSSGTLALIAAVHALRDGDLEVGIAGGADSLCLLTYSGFNALRSVDEHPSRPFRVDREGLSLGEGAGVLVVETLEHALARGAQPLAEVVGCGASCDAHHMTAPDPSGEGPAAAVEAALADGAVHPGEISFINAHGTGTPHNDVAECSALHRVFGETVRAIPVTTVKGAIGHLLGSAGAVEAVATVLSLVHRQVHPIPAGGEVDPGIALDVVMGRPRELELGSTGLSLSLAFGGANAAVVLSDWQPETAP